MQIELERVSYTETATLGQIVLPSGQRIVTLERPWIPNPKGAGGALGESCVPDGLYSLVAHDSEKHPGTYQLWADYLGVYGDVRPSGQEWGRTEILVHKANRVRDLLGCIGVGMQRAIIDEELWILRSGEALEALVKVLGRGDEIHDLRIRPTRGTTP